MNVVAHKNFQMLLFGIFTLMVGYYVITRLVTTQYAPAASLVLERIELQTKRVVLVADATKQNQVYSSVENVVKDCAPDSRKRFDTLLDKLSTTISAPELSELTGLFYQCGDFYARQRSLMSAVLNREVSGLEDSVALLNSLQAASSTIDSNVKTWKDIATAETKIAGYFNQLVDLQGSIIKQLTAGKVATDPEVKSILSEVAKTNGQMVVLIKQVEDYRGSQSSI